MVLTQQGAEALTAVLASSFHTTMVLTQQRELRNQIAQISKFPYHYGSHATDICHTIMFSCSQRFHTTMVLTQLTAATAWWISSCCFHTTMVLTQPANGSIVTAIYPSRFHTTMVLTQQVLDDAVYPVSLYVSIPLWFSRNSRRTEGFRRLHSPFPYHYGSHATPRTTQSGQRIQIVSIPLWFSRN